MSEKKPRKPRTNHKSQIEDVILYCKCNVDILVSNAPAGDASGETVGKVDAFKSVLRRLGQEVQ